MQQEKTYCYLQRELQKQLENETICLNYSLQQKLVHHSLLTKECTNDKIPLPRNLENNGYF